MRAVVVNPNAFVSKRRRAEDCPPYLRASVRECGGPPPLFPRIGSLKIISIILFAFPFGGHYLVNG